MTKNEAKQWVKDHKKELIIAGISIASITVILIGIKKKDSINAVLEKLKKFDKNTSMKEKANLCEILDMSSDEVPQISDSLFDMENVVDCVKRAPHSVRGHVRNLTGGRNPSQKKLEEARELGIDLLLHQTWVDEYMTGEDVA